MNDSEIRRRPATVADILLDTEALGFNMTSEPKAGALLAVLAASKPGGGFWNWEPERDTGQPGVGLGVDARCSKGRLIHSFLQGCGLSTTSHGVSCG